jgi:hypothetical protein
MSKEFITNDNLNVLFSKSNPTRADILQGGGIIIQSGLSNFNTGSMTATVSYPKTFPTKCCVVQLTPNNYYGHWSKGDVLTIKSFTNSSCTVELVGTPPVNTRSEFFWLAIGY